MTLNIQRSHRVLSLDGGGVRGISSLVILDEIMRTLNLFLSRRLIRPLPRNLEPFEAFDLMFGTSAGGLSALMLARLNMCVRHCMLAVRFVSNAVFRHGRTYAYRTQGLVSRSLPTYSSDAMREALIDVDDTDQPLRPHAQNLCQCYVVCEEVDVNGSWLGRPPVCLGTTNNSEINCQIWEAGRATSAAPGFFTPAAFSGSGQAERYFEDGGLGWNNPIWTFGRFQGTFINLNNARGECYVSIGTGKPEPQTRQEVRSRWWRLRNPVLRTASQNLARIATRTEEDHHKFKILIQSREGDPNYPVSYHRFNCENGLAAIELDEWSQINEIVTLTRGYIQSPRFQTKLDVCIQALSALTN